MKLHDDIVRSACDSHTAPFSKMADLNIITHNEVIQNVKSMAYSTPKSAFLGSRNATVTSTRKPCCRKEAARCRKCSFPLKFANNIHYKHKTSQASKAATLQSSKHAGAKRNLTQNQDSKSIKVTCLESVEKQ